MASRGGSASVPKRGARSGGRNRTTDSTSATAGKDGQVFAGSKRSRPAGGAARVQTPAPASQPLHPAGASVTAPPPDLGHGLGDSDQS